MLILVVAIDVPFQVFSFNKKLKMTKQEVKDEMKETEGRPEVKSAIREKQQEFARQRHLKRMEKREREAREAAGNDGTGGVETEEEGNDPHG